MKDLDLVVSIRQSLALGSRIHPKHAGGTYQEARPIPVRMDLRSTAPAERGGRGEASPREETWPSLACSSCPLGTGGDGPRRKLPGGKRAGEGIGGETGRADEGGAAGGARAGRLRSYQDEGKWLLPLFFRGVRACPFFFSGDLGGERRRGGRRGGRRGAGGGRADRSALAAAGPARVREGPPRRVSRQVPVPGRRQRETEAGSGGWWPVGAAGYEIEEGKSQEPGGCGVWRRGVKSTRETRKSETAAG
jgi:hypothetical protein